MAARPRLFIAVMCIAVIGAAVGCTSSSSASTASEIEGLPLPPSAHELELQGEVIPEHAQRRVYVARDETSLADVRDFYAHELPVGEDFRDWPSCGPGGEPSSSRAWQRGTRVLTLEYFRQSDSSLEIPPGWVVIIVAEYPRGAARPDQPTCDSDA